MTDEELDLLASAYVDGEATPDEVALVERDPELQARVELFRSVQVEDDGAGSTPPAGLVDRHLSAALAEFEAIRGADGGATDGADAPDEVGRTAPVVDLRDATRRADRSGAAASAGGAASRTGRSSSKRARTMPSWLPAAAGFVIVGGGFLWAVGQTGGDDDSAETASLAIDDSADDSATDAAGGDDGDADAMTAMSDDVMEESDDAMEEEAMEEDAMDEDEGEAARADEAAESAAAPAEGDGDDDESAEDAEEELVEPEPLLFFDEIPDVDAIVDLPEPETDIERSLCGPEIITTTLGTFVGFIPVTVEERPAEIYLFEDGDGAEIRLLIDEACEPIEP